MNNKLGLYKKDLEMVFTLEYEPNDFVRETVEDETMDSSNPENFISYIKDVKQLTDTDEDFIIGFKQKITDVFEEYASFYNLKYTLTSQIDEENTEYEFNGNRFTNIKFFTITFYDVIEEDKLIDYMNNKHQHMRFSHPNLGKVYFSVQNYITYKNIDSQKLMEILDNKFDTLIPNNRQVYFNIIKETPYEDMYITLKSIYCILSLKVSSLLKSIYNLYNLIDSDNKYREEISRAYIMYLVKSLIKYMKDNNDIELKWNVRCLKVKTCQKIVIYNISVIV